MEDQVKSIEQLIAQGRYLEARALTEELVKGSPDLRVHQLHALALSKSGMPAIAKTFLEKVYTIHPDDAETSGILAGIYKELFKQSEDSEYAIQSRDTYLKNFTLTGSYYTGINAATMSAVAGQTRKGKEIANQVVGKIGNGESFWEMATLGEAFLLTKENQKSIDCYLKARKLAGTDWGKISSVYNQLWLIEHYMHVPTEITKIFSPPAVAAFVGHMIDRPNRASLRFPRSIEGAVKAAIKASIRTNKIAIGYSSLACGGDILFAEALKEEGGEMNIFLPFNKEDFIRESVAFAGEDWVQRFDAIAKNQYVHYITQERYNNHTDLFSMQSKVVLGSTLLRRSMIHSDAFLISVLSEFDFSKMEGGTRDNISLWPFRDKLIHINPDNFLEGGIKAQEGPLPVKSVPTEQRPALYTVVIDSSKSEENNKLFQLIEKVFGEVLVPPLANCIVDNKLVVGFESLRPLWDFIQLLRKTKGVAENQLMISINGGPILLGDHHEKDTVQYKAMTGVHLDAAVKAHHFSEAGECIALSPIAYEFPLYKIELELLSRVNIEGGAVAEVFKVLG